MRRADYPQALERAAKSAMATLERDELRAPVRLRPLFAAMRDLFLEPNTDLDRIARAAGFEDASICKELRTEIGQPAWDYLREMRFEIATRLLLETPIPLREIGRMVGFVSSPSFQRGLRDYLGMSASQYRRRAPRYLERGGRPPDGVETEAYWQRMLAGELSGKEARKLDDYLSRLAMPEDSATTSSEEATDPQAVRYQRMRRRLAEGLVASLKSMDSFADRRRLLREAIHFPDGSLFERLSRESRATDAGKVPEASPNDGVEWALLALDSLAANGMLEDDPGRGSLAWMRLAMARWRFGDLVGAAHDVEQSTRDLERAGDDVPERWLAEIYSGAAAFHGHHERWQLALSLAERAVANQRDVSSRSSDREALGQALALRAELRAALAELESDPFAERLNELRDALQDASEAIELLAPGDVRRSANDFRARLIVRVGTRKELASTLPELREAWGSITTGDPAEQAEWLEGHAKADAEAREAHWQRARERLSDRGEVRDGQEQLWAARISLDLAHLHLDEDSPLEAQERIEELVDALAALAVSAEDILALRALGTAAIQDDGVTREDLGIAEQVWTHLEWQGRAKKMLRLAL